MREEETKREEREEQSSPAVNEVSMARKKLLQDEREFGYDGRGSAVEQEGTRGGRVNGVGSCRLTRGSGSD